MCCKSRLKEGLSSAHALLHAVRLHQRSTRVTSSMHMKQRCLLSLVNNAHAACLECPAQPADHIALQGEALAGGLVLACARLWSASPNRRGADGPTSEVQAGVAQVLRRGRDHLHRCIPLGLAVACGAQQLEREGYQLVTAQLQTPANKYCEGHMSDMLRTREVVHVAASRVTPARG